MYSTVFPRIIDLIGISKISKIGRKKKGNRKKQTITLNNEDAPTGLRGSVRDTSGGRKRRSAALPYLGVDRVSRRQRLL